MVAFGLKQLSLKRGNPQGSPNRSSFMEVRCRCATCHRNHSSLEELPDPGRDLWGQIHSSGRFKP